MKPLRIASWPRKRRRSAWALGGVLDVAIGNHILHLECAGAPRATDSALGLVFVVRPDLNDLHRQLVAFWARDWQIQHLCSRGELFYCRTKAMRVG